MSEQMQARLGFGGIGLLAVLLLVLALSGCAAPGPAGQIVTGEPKPAPGGYLKACSLEPWQPYCQEQRK